MFTYITDQYPYYKNRAPFFLAFLKFFLWGLLKPLKNNGKNKHLSIIFQYIYCIVVGTPNSM